MSLDSNLNNKRILVGITGGIAAYKAVLLVRELKKLGADVQVVMTQAAEAFVTPMTLQALSGRPVRRDLFDEDSEAAMSHIEQAKWADHIIIAPATANMIAKLAHGFADDLLTTIHLASSCPVLVCPAMNQAMWHHPATQENLETLKRRGVMIAGPAAGHQACGDEGPGRMIEPDAIIQALRMHTAHNLLQGKRVVITAGPTREPIDPVRYLTNRSSGKMGYALASAAHIAGADVVLVSGPTALPAPDGVILKKVNTAAEMHDAVMYALQPEDVFIAAAAVSDYKPDVTATQKLKKQHADGMTLTLVQNQDILKAVSATKKAALVMGFAAETEALEAHAREKLHKKNLDCIVANLVSESQGFDVDDNEVALITPDKTYCLSKKHKDQLAAELVAFIAATLQNDKHLFPVEAFEDECLSTT